MKNKGLLSKLVRKALPSLAGVVGLASAYGCSGKPTEPPNPGNQSPIASCVVQPKEGDAPLTVYFNGSASKSRNPDGTIRKYIWTFGDGSADSTSGDGTQHVYSGLGNYNASLTVEDDKGTRSAKTCDQVNVNPTPQSRISVHLEDVLTGVATPGVPVFWQNVVRDTSDANGNVDFQVPVSSDTLKISSNQFYNVKIPVNANNQNTGLGTIQLISRYTDPVTGEGLLGFMERYMLSSRWDDADLPVKVFIDNNPPSPEYREAARQGIMSWDASVNAWLPEGRKITLAQIVNADPAIGIRVDYNSTNPTSFYFENLFKKGIIKINQIQGVNGVLKATAHESGHGLGWNHTPYSNQAMCGACPSLPSPFEGLVVATKYKLKKDAVGLYSK